MSIANWDGAQWVRYCTYHSQEWEELVNAGWITCSVTNDVAKMVRP